ncbi:MAG: hypothetical protein IT313_05550 [Anaerolineales bacterium]|nr:hypothetical protein [Anaerolineales bacterium]
MKIRFSGKFLLISCIFLLAGCHKLEATTRINPNGSGELQMGIGFSAEERANLEKQNITPQAFCNTEQKSPNVTVTEEQRGEETWCINTTSFKSLDELRGLYQQRPGITINRLEIKDGKFYYDVDIDTLSENSSFSNLTEITWTVVMPGTPLAHNADEANGNTLTWKPAPKSGIVNLRAESEAPRGFVFPQCGATLAIFGILLIQVKRRKQNFGSL